MSYEYTICTTIHYTYSYIYSAYIPPSQYPTRHVMYIIYISLQSYLYIQYIHIKSSLSHLILPHNSPYPIHTQRS